MQDIIQWCSDNWELVAPMLLAILAVVAKAAYRYSAVVQGAQILADSIRRNANLKGSAEQVKLSVSMADGTIDSTKSTQAPIVANQVVKPSVVDAIQDIINTVDPLKPTPTKRQILVRELVRGVPIVAGLAKKFLLSILLVCVVAACTTLPQITTTDPDGTVTVRTDIEAVAALSQIATQSAQALMVFISDMEARKAEAEARGDAQEAAKWDKQAALARESLALILQSIPPKTTSSEATSNPTQSKLSEEVSETFTMSVDELKKYSLALPETP